MVILTRSFKTDLMLYSAFYFSLPPRPNGVVNDACPCRLHKRRFADLSTMFKPGV